VNLKKVQVSLGAVCPKCGKAISSAEYRALTSTELNVRRPVNAYARWEAIYEKSPACVSVS
jgi:hypothetical protein